MNIIVCVKRVPFTQEVDLEIDPEDKDIDREDLAYVINDWDHYAIEAAVRLQEELGGTVTAVTLGSEEDEEVLRRCLAMGADRAIRIDPGARRLDGAGVARVLARVIGPLAYDLILTGVQAEDDNQGVVGIMTAELLGLNHAAVVTALEPGEGELLVRCELEGGVDERSKIRLPALLTVQTGLNEPRYVSIMGIKKAAKKPLEVLDLADLGLAEAELVPRTLMSEIFVVVEHRQGIIRDITFEMLHLARKLSREDSGRTTAVFLGSETGPLVPQLSSRAERILVLDDPRFASFDGRVIGEALFQLLQEYRPRLTLIGQTSWGLDLAPGLAVKTGYPLATDCVDIRMANGRPEALRQMYSGKVFCRVSFPEAPGYLCSVRPGAFPADADEALSAEVVSAAVPFGLPEPGKQFLEFIESEAGEVDIAQAEFLVSIGRGVGEVEKLAQVQDLARSLGAALSCSRPVVDKKWLPKYHQVGTSGKSVKPKVYLALGISGAFQHLAGIAGAGTVIAVNKDPKAPIFRAAQYGVAEDIFKIIPALMEKIAKK